MDAPAEGPEEPREGPIPPSAPGGGNCRFELQARADGVVGVAVDGDLDPEAARTLLEVVETAIGLPGSSRHVEIDLRGLRACSNSGVRALTACAELGARVRDGLQFRVGISPGLADDLARDGVTLEQ